MSVIQIGERSITRGSLEKPYFIAEAGVNHEGDIDKAKLMIEQAARAGADAIKFQTYKAESLASKNSPAYWDTTQETTQSQFELFRKHDKFWSDEFEALAKYSQDQKIHFLSTPFDFEAVDLLEALVPAYKVASADITNFPLLNYIAKKGKPILLSTGASTISEIYRAVEVIQGAGDVQVALLHCVLNYPTPLEDANIGMIWHMEKVFPDHIIGYSDHTLPEFSNDVLTASWLLGAQVIEKHFTFDKSLPGNDHYHAMDESDLAAFQRHLESVIGFMGETNKTYLPSEVKSRHHARRSLVAARAIGEGEEIKMEDFVIKRPGTGISPELIDYVIGAEALRDIEEDEILTFDLLKFKSSQSGS